MKRCLSEHKEAGKYIVENICKSSGLYARLAGQGLYSGKEFEIISFTQGKYVLKFDNSKLTLDREVAEHISVRKCGKACFWTKLGNKFSRNKEQCRVRCSKREQNKMNSEIIGEKLEVPIEKNKHMMI